MLVLGTGALHAATQDSESAGDSNYGDRHYESLTVGELSFEDVWVHRQTNAVILIRHSMGIHSINLTDLPAEELRELQSQVGELAEVDTDGPSWWESGLLRDMLNMFSAGTASTKIILVIVAGLVVALFAIRVVGKRNPVAA